MPIIKKYSTGSSTDITDDVSSALAFFPLFANVSSGALASTFTSAAKLNWVPSTGTLTATRFAGNGSLLTNLDAGNIASGTVPTARLGSGTANASSFLRGDGTWSAAGGGAVISDDTSTNSGLFPLFATTTTGTLSTANTSSTKLTYNPSTGRLVSTAFSGNGSLLTNLNAGNIASGTVPTARLGSGTADNTTYLRGDGTWQTVSGGSTVSDDVATNSDFYPLINANTSGLLSTPNVSSTKLTFNPSTGRLTATALAGSGALVTNLNASNLATGTVGTARLGTGTADNTTYLRGDGTWQIVAAGLALTDDTTTNSPYFPLFSTTSSGTATAAKVSSTKLTFNPLTGVLVAKFSGDGSLLTDLNASNLATGTVGTARLGTGTADNTTYLRGDGTWQTVSAGLALTDDVATNSTYYPLVSTSASGTATAAKVSSTKLTYNPSTGTLDATVFAGSGASLTNLNGSAIATGTVPAARLGSGTTNNTTYLRGDGTWATIASGVTITDETANATRQIVFVDGFSGPTTEIKTCYTKLTFVPSSGLLTSTAFAGVGAALTQLNASNLFSGTVPTARLGSGTADNTTYLRGDGTWQTISGGATLSDDTSTNSAHYPTLSTTTTGTYSTAKVSSTKLSFNPSTGLLTATGFSGNGSALTNLDASNLATGTVGSARLGTGTADNTTYLRGDGTWATVSATGVTTATANTLAQRDANADLYAMNFVAMSDRDLKRDINYNIDEAVLKLQLLKPASYSFDINPDLIRYGLIAQDAQDVLPEIVRTNSEGQLSISYLDLIPLLIAQVQKLTQEVNTLKGL